jgi:hypothetical protein
MSDQTELVQKLANTLGIPIFTATLEEGITSTYPQPSFAQQLGAEPDPNVDRYGRAKLPARFAHDDEVVVAVGDAYIKAKVLTVSFTLEDVFYDLDTSNGLVLYNIDSNFVYSPEEIAEAEAEDTFAEVLTVQGVNERRDYIALDLSSAEFGGYTDQSHANFNIPGGLPFEVRPGDKLLVTVVPVVAVEETAA